MYFKKKLEIKESVYNSCFFDKFGFFGIIKMQIDNILILVDNNWTYNNKKIIKIAKIIIKNLKFKI